MYYDCDISTDHHSNKFNMLIKILEVVSFFVILHIAKASEYKIVTISTGKIRGQKYQTIYEQIEYYAYRGIPFAKPPIGNLRFKVHYK